MTSTLTSMRRLSVRFGATTVDLAVPVGTRLGDLLVSGGFPAGSRLVDASGAPLPDDDRVGDTVEDGALLYVVDAAHTPSLTRVTPTAPARGSAAGSVPARTSEPGPATAAGPTAAPVHVDSASAGARTRSAARRTARARAATAAGPGTGTREVPPGPNPPTAPDGSPGPDGAPAPTGRRAVVPPTVRRPGLSSPPADSAAGRTVPPPPSGATRSPVPLPPGRAPRGGAHAARHGATGADDTGSAADAGADEAGTGVELVPARRGGSGLAVPPPPRVAPPPSGATGRGAVAAGRGGHRAASTDTPAEPVRRGGPDDVALSPGTFAVPMVLVAAVVVVVLLSTGTPGLPAWTTWTAGAALLVAGVVAAIRPGMAPLQRWARIAGVLAGGAGGFVLAVGQDVSLDVAAVSGLLVAAAVAMLGRVAAVRQGVFDPWITVTAVSAGALAVDAALAITLSWPLYVGPLLLAGVSPLVMRALPALSLDVPEEQLVDTERLSNTSWSARTGVKRRRRPLRQATVELITLRASGIVAAGTVSIGVLVTFGYGLAVLSPMPDSLATWALLAEGVLLLGGIGLAARTVRARFGKRVLRSTAAVVTLETGFHLLGRIGDAGDVVLVALLVGVALGVVAVSVALDSGWRSLRLSRIADTVEGFCVVFALPAALLAADVIAVLRQAAS